MAAPTNLSNFVLRPDTGTLGRPVKVRANFFRVLDLPTQEAYRYDVDVEPFLPVQKKRALWQLFEETHPEVVGNTKSIFDGRRNVFSVVKFTLGQTQAQAFTVDIANNSAFGRGTKDTIFTIRLKLANTINMQELTDLINGASPCTTNCLTAIMLLDILVRFLPSQTQFTYKRSIFTAADKVPLSNGAEVWYGHYQSLRPAKGNMFVSIDMSGTAMHESGPLPEIAAKVLGKRSLNELRMGIPDHDMIMLTRLLKGQSIQVVHRGEQGRFNYKITNLAGPANQVTFADTEGRTTLVSDYFLQRYNRRLNYPFLPCVVVRKNVFLPMEVCEIAPGQRFTKRLNSRQTAEFITATAKPPQVRFNKINQGLNLLRHKNNPYLEEFGLNINQEMEMIHARIMEPPRVSFGQTTIRPQSNGWNLQGKRFKQPAELKSWSLVNFAGAVPIQAIQRFIRELITTFAGLGMNVTNRAPPTLNADPQSNIERTLKEAWLNAGKQAQAEPQLIVCILPNRGPQLYGEIKRITDTVIGVPSQCLQSKFIADAKKQYCANVALKVNVKLGGSNHTLNNGEIPFVSDRPTIVFGIDVSHPFPGSNAPSVAAVTASMDSMATRFVSTIRLQARTEIVSDLSNVIAELLRKFYQKTGMKPQRMIFYRDGVSDSQFQQVVTNEVSAIRQACALLEDGFKPNITFVVVQKRHRARFLPMNRADSDRSGNCVPGLVVDTDITHPFEFDFYLQAHAAIKGTARSAHYCVLYDENQFNANSLQDLTFKLCHSFARSTGSVSLVPAVYYADLVAARARLHRPGGDWSDSTMAGDTGEMQAQMAAYATVHAKLQDTMYFM